MARTVQRDFSGGAVEERDPEAFDDDEAAVIHGLVHEDTGSLRTQWPVHTVGEPTGITHLWAFTPPDFPDGVLIATDGSNVYAAQMPPADADAEAWNSVVWYLFATGLVGVTCGVPWMNANNPYYQLLLMANPDLPEKDSYGG